MAEIKEDIKYTVEKRGPSPEDTIILKTGLTAVFNIGQVTAEIARLEKLKREMQGQVDVEQAKMTNIEAHHPFVLKMSEQDLFTAHMYQGCKSVVVVGGHKIDEVNALIKGYQDEIAEIKNQIPDIDTAVAPVETPVAPAADAPVATPAEVPATPVEIVAAPAEAPKVEEGIPSPAEFLPGNDMTPGADAPDANNLK